MPKLLWPWERQLKKKAKLSRNKDKAKEYLVRFGHRSSYLTCIHGSYSYFVESNVDLARSFWATASKQGNCWALNIYGACMSEETLPNESESWAVQLLSQAAEKGHAAAIHNLGLCYLQGQGVAENKQRALQLFKDAAERGHVSAMIQLGCCYERGWGVTPDPVLAFEYYKKGASTNDKIAIFNVGICFGRGIGRKQNRDKAVKWLQRAANLHYKEAEKALDSISLYMFNAQHNHLFKPPVVAVALNVVVDVDDA
ncbi:SEL1 protein [Pelomyxa schiedti]|nr:SEL1 protein [Pelomyxa schiedti]